LNRLRSFLAALLAVPLLGGCGLADYYWQGVAGQVGLLAGARPVEEVVASTEDARLADRLKRAQSIRAYASASLGLPDNASYTRYTELGRPFVVWNVFATHELSLRPKQWCYPLVGCVSYRGYFSEADAKAEAARLVEAGFDVHLGGVPAYSTLGWFDDPLLSSFVRYPDTALARLVFHELAHQVVYVRDDTAFNESFATAVEQAGLSRWIEAQAGTPQYDRLRAVFTRLVREARGELEVVYASPLSDEAKRVRKAEVFAAMRAGYEAAKAGDVGLAAYDRWFAEHDGKGPNNASLAAIALYDDKVPAFRALLAEVDGDLPRFYERVRELSKQPKSQRDAMLAQRLPTGLAGTP
jgi:predicted aminopeptidase